MKTTSEILRDFVQMMDEAWAPYGGYESDRPYAEAMRVVREAAEKKQREGD